MLFGFLAGLAALIWPILAYPFAYTAWAMLEYVIRIAEWTAQIPLASVNYENFGVWMLVSYYILLLGWLNRLQMFNWIRQHFLARNSPLF